MSIWAEGEVFVGPVDVPFAEGDYPEPDVVFVAREHAHLLHGARHRGAEDTLRRTPKGAGTDLEIRVREILGD